MFLQEVYWPSITLCNLNQAEASYWKSIGAHSNTTKKLEILQEYFAGTSREGLQKSKSKFPIVRVIQNHIVGGTKFSRKLIKNAILYKNM